MKAIGKGVCVLLMTLLLFGLAVKARAGELEDLLKGKAVVYIGTCWFDAKGVLTFKRENMTRTERCVVGMELPDTTRHFVMLVTERGPKELLVWDERTQVQEKLWPMRDSV